MTYRLKYEILISNVTCRSFSAVGLFFVFLVSESLTNWWKLLVLEIERERERVRERFVITVDLVLVH